MSIYRYPVTGTRKAETPFSRARKEAREREAWGAFLHDLADVLTPIDAADQEEAKR